MNNNNNVIINHVAGNLLRLAIPLTIKKHILVDGVITVVTEDFYPDTDHDVIVDLYDGLGKHNEYVADIVGNVASIQDSGTLRPSTYSVQVKCFGLDGNPYRYKVGGVIKIHDLTRDAGIEPSIEFDGESYTLDGVVFLSYYTDQVQSDWGETDNTKKSFIKRKPDLSIYQEREAGKGLSTNDYTNEDKQKVDSALQSETDPTVPQWAKQSSKPSYTAQEVGALPNSTKYGSTIDLSMDSATYVLTLSLKDQDGTVLNTKTVDLPIESVVVNGRYDAANKKIVLTLQSGSTIDVPVGDLIAGLQTEITSVNMLDADLVDDTNSTHKFVTTQEKTTWNNKSDFSGSYNDLTDKPTIPAAQIQSDWNQSDNSAADYIKNKPTNVSSFTNDAGYLTQHQSLADYSTTQEMDSAIATATNDMATMTWVGEQGYLTQHQDISGKEDNENKVTTLSAQNTDTQYPSAKCVYNSLPTTMGASGSGHKGGLVPDTPSTTGTTKFLREDGTWQVPTSTTPERLGFGIGVCSTAAATAAKTVAITDYQLVKNGFVAVTFQNDVPASATLNINSLGAKPIYYKGKAIAYNVINAGDTVTFCYDGTNYVIASPMKLEKVTFRAYSDNAKTTPVATTVYVARAGESFKTVDIDNTGVSTIYLKDGTYSITSVISALSINSFSVIEDCVIDIIADNSGYIDLGLPSGLLWATCNIGADTPTEAGKYFSWGNTFGKYASEVGSGEGKYSFSQENYALTDGSKLGVTGGIALDNNLIPLAYDAARVNLGGANRMPTPTICNELFAKQNDEYLYVSVKWTTINGVYGIMVISKGNGKSVFFPRAGYCQETSVAGINSFGLYWEASNCNYIRIGQGNVLPVYNGSSMEYYGMSIRPVLSPCTVTINLTDDNGNAVANMPLDITIPGAPTEHVRTDANGAATFRSLKATITISCVAATINTTSVVVTGDTVVNITATNLMAIDMGVSVLWAKSNIDVTQADGLAASPFQYECSYFSWGNTDGHNPTANNSFSPWSWGTSNDSEPYVSSDGAALNGDIGLSHDAARVHLGEPWRMPTSAEYAELQANVDFVEADGVTVIDASQTDKRVTVNDIVGVYLKSKVNDNLLFFPCSGNGYQARWIHGSHGDYWSSSLGNAGKGMDFGFDVNKVYQQKYDFRYFGFPIRPVC